MTDRTIAVEPGERHILNLSCTELVQMASVLMFFFSLIKSPLFVKTLYIMAITEPDTFFHIMAASNTIGGLDKITKKQLEEIGLEGMSDLMHKNMKILYELMHGQVLACKEAKK